MNKLMDGDEYLERLKNEKEELKNRYDKLKQFIKSDKFKQLDEIDKELVIEHKIVINWYINILIKRVKKHGIEMWGSEVAEKE